MKTKWTISNQASNLEAYKNWEDLYEISNEGDVYSLRRGKCLKPRLSLDGYKRVCLFKDGKGYEYRVARLVAEAFIENPKINHR